MQKIEMANVLSYLKNLRIQKKLAAVYLVLPPCGHGENAMALWSKKLALEIESWEQKPNVSTAQMGHPDILILHPESGRANYVVDNFDEYLTEINYRPRQWEYRYIIIEAADRIPPIVANKLLMSLEFTPTWCIHFLLCDSKRPMLPTVESRAVNINLNLEDIRDKTLAPAAEIKLPANLQDLLKDIQKNTEQSRRWEADLLQLILQHPQFDHGDASLHLSKILSRNVMSSAFNNPSSERLVPLWHLLKGLHGQN